MRLGLRFRCWVLLITVAPLPAWAAAAGGDDGQLPQLRTEHFAGQLFWLIISFGLLYLVIARVAVPRIAKVQTQRNDILAADLAAANAASQHAKQIAKDFEASLASARQTANDNLNAIIMAAKAAAAEQEAAQQAELMATQDQAEAEIAASRAVALAGIPAAVPAVAHAMVQQLTGMAAPPEQLEAIVKMLASSTVTSH